MQAVCDQKPFGMFAAKAESFSQAVSTRNTMNRAELLLEWQIFLGGLAVSTMMLLAISAFKLW